QVQFQRRRLEHHRLQRQVAEVDLVQLLADVLHANRPLELACILQRLEALVGARNVELRGGLEFRAEVVGAGANSLVGAAQDDRLRRDLQDADTLAVGDDEAGQGRAREAFQALFRVRNGGAFLEQRAETEGVREALGVETSLPLAYRERLEDTHRQASIVHARQGADQSGEAD